VYNIIIKKKLGFSIEVLPTKLKRINKCQVYTIDIGISLDHQIKRVSVADHPPKKKLVIAVASGLHLAERGLGDKCIGLAGGVRQHIVGFGKTAPANRLQRTGIDGRSHLLFLRW